jgi:putative glutamine amidotransferase
MNAGEPADPSLFVRERHLQALRRAGLEPLLMPDPGALDLLDLCACAYLPGGDYVPLRRDEEPEQSARRAAGLGMPWDAAKVAADLAVLDAAWERRLPVLAICGGMQAMALHAGGGVRAATVDERVVHGEDPGPCAQPVEAGTLAAEILGDSAAINHHHVQVVDDAGSLVVGARAVDGPVEAVEAPRDEHPFWLGLQWHPERLGDPAPYRALAAAVAAQRSFSNQ